MRAKLPPRVLTALVIWFLAAMSVGVYLESSRPHWLEQHPLYVNLLSGLIGFPAATVTIAFVFQSMLDKDTLRRTQVAARDEFFRRLIQLPKVFERVTGIKILSRHTPPLHEAIVLALSARLADLPAAARREQMRTMAADLKECLDSIDDYRDQHPWAEAMFRPSPGGVRWGYAENSYQDLQSRLKRLTLLAAEGESGEFTDATVSAIPVMLQFLVGVHKELDVATRSTKRWAEIADRGVAERRRTRVPAGSEG